MMRRNVETTRTARICQLASVLTILSMVLGMLVHDIVRGSSTTAAERQTTRLVAAP